MNATDKAEALRLLDEMDRAASYIDMASHHASAVSAYDSATTKLRSLLSAQGEAEPSAEQWRQAIVDYCHPNAIGDLPQRASDWIEQRARELARKGVGNG